LAKLTIAFGGLLIILGVGGYFLTGAQSITALIPAFAGIVFEILGFIALKPDLRKHAMHGAAALALLGFLGTIPGLIKLAKWMIGGVDPARPAAVVSQSIMAALCVIYLVLCVRSFINARRNQGAGFPVNQST
jgi:hypothetical protein